MRRALAAVVVALAGCSSSTPALEPPSGGGDAGSPDAPGGFQHEITVSMEILKNFLPVYVDKCIRGIAANRERCEAYYISSPSLATALNPLIGYAAAAEIAKESAKTGQRIPDLLREKQLLGEDEIARIFTPEFLAGQADRTE